MEDEEEYYRHFLESITYEQDLPSDEEEFLVVEDAQIDTYSPRIPRSELIDLVLESDSPFGSIQSPYSPVVPVCIPKFTSRPLDFPREQRISLLLQIEAFVQLLVQGILLSPDRKEELVGMLKDLLEYCQSSHSPFDVSFLLNGRAKITIPTQCSMLHIPLVEAVRQCFSPTDLANATLSRREIKNKLGNFAPAFVNKSLLPLENPPFPKQNKHGFSIHDDILLLQGINKSTDPLYLHENWLFNKPPQQIKNRIKNLKSKKYKAKNEAQFRVMRLLEDKKKTFDEDDLNMLTRGIHWFGIDRAFLIQKYFLPHRTIKQITEIANLQIQQTSSNFNQGSIQHSGVCSCNCQCQDLFESYYIP